MTISTLTRVKSYVGNGVTTVFPYDFYIPDAASLKVYHYDTDTLVRTLLSSATYSVTGLGSEAYGDVTYPLTGSPLDSTEQIIIVREVALTQEVEINNQSGFLPEVVEQALDLAVMMVQQLNERQSRAIELPEGEAFAGQLPARAVLANKLLMFDANGDPTAVLAIPASSVTLPLSVANGGTAGITPAAARTNIGAAASADITAVQTAHDLLEANFGSVRVRAATTANITIATALNNGDVLDGVTLVTGDLVLVKDQATAAQNGIYPVSASPVRSALFDAYNEHPGRLFIVEEGTANADTVWECTSSRGGTIDVTALAFAALWDRVKVAASATVAGIQENAVQSEMETGTSILLNVTPGVQHSHPGHPKCLAYVTVAAGVPTLAWSYNITSITDTAAGKLTITIATDFASAAWVGSCSLDASLSGAHRFTANFLGSSKTAGSCLIEAVQDTAGGFADPAAWNFSGYGDHA